MDEKIKRAIRGKWIGLLMDGRNEHGTHFLPVPPDGLCLPENLYEDLFDSKNGDVERIFSEAESSGYIVGCCIIVACETCEDEGGYYYELRGIDDDLTRLIYGCAEDQICRIEEMASADFPTLYR